MKLKFQPLQRLATQFGRQIAKSQKKSMQRCHQKIVCASDFVNVSQGCVAWLPSTRLPSPQLETLYDGYASAKSGQDSLIENPQLWSFGQMSQASVWQCMLARAPALQGRTQ